jgi:hypothetical protein
MNKANLILIGVGVAVGYFLTQQVVNVDTNIPGQPFQRAFNFGGGLAV